MATTTNYSWTTPDDTALVKDGAAAIRSLGTAIDTTVFNNASAAIAKTIVDAKGDIIAATAADTVGRLAVGSNNQILTADSSTSTGLKWSTPSSGGMTLLSTTTLSGSETSISISDTSYINLCIIIEDWQLNSNGTLRVRLNSLNGDPNYAGWGGYIRAYNFENGATPLSGDALYISQQTFVSGNKSNSGFLVIYNYANTNSWKLSQYAVSGASTVNDGYAIVQMGSFNVATADAISSFQFITTSTFNGGTVKIYGVK